LKKLIWIIILILIILLLLWVYSCNRKPGTGDANLKLGPAAYSIWADGSTSLSFPIENVGDSSAANVQLATVTFGSGTRVTPASLPLSLGEIVPTRRAIVDSRFSSLVVPGTYEITISGTYTVRGKTKNFSDHSSVVLEKSGGPAPPPAHVTVPKQKTPGSPIPPSPIKPETDNNPAGPPIPKGEPITPFAVAPSTTGVAPSSSGASGVTFIRDTGTGQSGNYPPDPITAAATNGSNVVFSTGNLYDLFSTDDGKTFTTIDPTTVGFPAADGGMCCDQVILYNARVNLFFWLIQYKNSAPTPPSATLTGPNRLRIAWASPESMKTNINAWTFFDLTAANFNLGQQGLDFPDMAFTDTFLYVSVDQQTSVGNVNGLIVARIPLSDITGPGSSVGISYYSSAQSSAQNTATGARLTQNGRDAMYWGGHVDSSHINVFRWADSNGNMDSPHSAVVNTWCQSDYTTQAPAGGFQQWLDSSRTSSSSIIGATRKPFRGLVPPGVTTPNGEVWLAWGSGRDVGGSTPCTQGRPQPYVKIARVNDQTLDTVGEYHIWNPAFAFAYPSLATDFNAEIGVSVAFGGSSNYASTTVGYLGDFVVYYVEASDVTLTFRIQQVDSKGNPIFDSAGNPVWISDSKGNPILFTRYGDYFSVRNSGASNTLFSAQGYAVKLVDSTKSTNCITTPGCTFRPHYEQWGRPAAPPPH
jgi:hypothetical protein